VRAPRQHMSRTATRKVLYLALLVGVAAIALVVLNALHYRLGAVLAYLGAFKVTTGVSSSGLGTSSCNVDTVKLRPCLISSSRACSASHG